MDPSERKAVGRTLSPLYVQRAKLFQDYKRALDEYNDAVEYANSLKKDLLETQDRLNEVEREIRSQPQARGISPRASRVAAPLKLPSPSGRPLSRTQLSPRVRFAPEGMGEEMGERAGERMEEGMGKEKPRPSSQAGQLLSKELERLED
jgi:hypothetical protein